MERNLGGQESMEETSISVLPPETIEKILCHIDNSTLAVAIPTVSKQFKDISADHGALWQYKCQSINLLDFRDNISWKKQFLDHTSHLFPIYGYTIGRVDYKELLNDTRATPAKPNANNPLLHVTRKPYVLVINGMQFCCNKLTQSGIDTSWSSTEFERGISEPPAKWKSLGFDLEGCFNDYYMLLLLRHSNIKVWNCRVLIGVLTARVSSIVKEGDLYFEIFIDIRAEGVDIQQLVLQRGSVRSMQVSYGEDLAQEYPIRIAVSTADLLQLRQKLTQRRKEQDIIKRIWTKIYTNLRSNDLTLIQHTLHDLTTLMQTSANTEALQSFKSKELLAEVGKFMVHEQLELRTLAGRFFIAFIRKFPKDADLINEENLVVLARKLNPNTTASENK